MSLAVRMSTGKKHEPRSDKKKYKSSLKGKEIQCRECEGFGHIQVECANTLKKNKSLNTTLSYEDKEETDHDDEDNNEASDTMAFNAVIDLKDNSLHVEDSASDEEISYEELQEKYNLMYAKWIELVTTSNTQNKDL